MVSKPGLGDLAQSMRLVEGVHEGQGKDDHQHHYDQGVDLKKTLHTRLKKPEQQKKHKTSRIGFSWQIYKLYQALPYAILWPVPTFDSFKNI